MVHSNTECVEANQKSQDTQYTQQYPQQNLRKDETMEDEGLFHRLVLPQVLPWTALPPLTKPRRRRRFSESFTSMPVACYAIWWCHLPYVFLPSWNLGPFQNLVGFFFSKQWDPFAWLLCSSQQLKLLWWWCCYVLCWSSVLFCPFLWYFCFWCGVFVGFYLVWSPPFISCP